MCVLSCAQLFVTPRTVAHQAPLSMEFSRKDNWSGLPFPTLGDLPDPGVSCMHLLHWQADSFPWHYLGGPSPRLCKDKTAQVCHSVDSVQGSHSKSSWLFFQPRIHVT